MTCEHREEGLLFKKKEIPHAIAYAKERYLIDGEKRFLYYCPKVECYGLPDSIHVGKGKKPGGKSGRGLNWKLVNFYSHWENFGTSSKKWKKKKRSFKELQRGVMLQMPFLVWEDDGGPCDPSA